MQKVTLEDLKQAIFSTGSIDGEWEWEEISILHQIQAQGEYILSALISSNRISAKESAALMSSLMSSYGYSYPLLVIC